MKVSREGTAETLAWRGAEASPRGRAGGSGAAAGGEGASSPVGASVAGARSCGLAVPAGGCGSAAGSSLSVPSGGRPPDRMAHPCTRSRAPTAARVSEVTVKSSTLLAAFRAARGSPTLGSLRSPPRLRSAPALRRSPIVIRRSRRRESMVAQLGASTGGTGPGWSPRRALVSPWRTFKLRSRVVSNAEAWGRRTNAGPSPAAAESAGGSGASLATGGSGYSPEHPDAGGSFRGAWPLSGSGGGASLEPMFAGGRGVPVPLSAAGEAPAGRFSAVAHRSSRRRSLMPCDDVHGPGPLKCPWGYGSTNAP